MTKKKSKPAALPEPPAMPAGYQNTDTPIGQPMPDDLNQDQPLAQELPPDRNQDTPLAQEQPGAAPEKPAQGKRKPHGTRADRD